MWLCVDVDCLIRGEVLFQTDTVIDAFACQEYLQLPGCIYWSTYICTDIGLSSSVSWRVSAICWSVLTGRISSTTTRSTSTTFTTIQERTGTTTGIKQSLVPKRALLRIWLIRIWGFTQHGLCFGYWNLDSGLSIISFIKDEFFISVAGSQVLRTQLPVCNALLWRLFQYLPKRDCDLLSATH